MGGYLFVFISIRRHHFQNVTLFSINLLIFIFFNIRLIKSRPIKKEAKADSGKETIDE